MAMNLMGRVAEIPMRSTIDSVRGCGYLVCDRDHNCREMTGLREEEESVRERQRGLACGFSLPPALSYLPSLALQASVLSRAGRGKERRRGSESS